MAAALAAASVGKATANLAMAERIADNAELLVDEMKRKARRRLVGAIVLALAAAIILPMLLEKEPRPLGDDVSVQIPPVDDGKFVNRLTGKTGDAKALPKTDSKPIAAAPGKSEAKAEVRRPPPSHRAPQAEPPSPSRPKRPTDGERSERSRRRSRAAAPRSQGRRQARSAVRARQRTQHCRGHRSPPRCEREPPATAPRLRAQPRRSPTGFVVQLAAFADDKGANALANKLKKSGYAAYVEPVNTSRGTLWRVRVGGYAYASRSGRRARGAEGRRLQRDHRAGAVTRGARSGAMASRTVRRR